MIALALLGFVAPELRADESSTNTPPTTNTTAVASNESARASTAIGTPMNPSRVTLLPGTMQLRQGFRLVLAAAEPDIINPVALAFDADGRLFVAEAGVNSSEGTIKRLEDLNGDGRFDRMTLFAGAVDSPTALVCYGAGVFVATAKEIIFLADADGDGRAEQRRVTYSGFATDATRPGSGITQLVWGPDNWIHAACNEVTGTVQCDAIASVKPLALAGHDFAFNPRTLEMELEAGGNSLGLAYDNAGRRFTTTRAAPFKFTVADVPRTSVNPLYRWPTLQADLATADWMIYPLKPLEKQEDAAGAIRTSQTAAKRFTIPRSLLAYRGTSLAKAFDNSLFVADPELRLISHWELNERGIAPTVQRPSATRTAEFLASRDPAFRPTQIVAGPDGALYLADLGRERLDETAERGRLWRVQPDNQPATPAPALSKLPSTELIKLLGTPNGWVRDTASRLLFERNDPDAYRTVAKELRWNWNPQNKAAALQLLAAANALEESALIRALQERDVNVRATAAALSTRLINNRSLSPALLGQLGAAARDASPRVRLETALTLGGVNHSSVPVMLASAIRPAPADPWIQSAVLTSAHRGGAGTVFGQLVGNANVHRDPGGWTFLRQLAWMAGTEPRLQLDSVLLDLDASGLRFDDQLLLAGDLGEGLFATGRSYFSGVSTNETLSLGNRALKLAVEGNNAAARADAIRFLGVGGYALKRGGDWLLVMLSPSEPEVVQLAAVDALAHFPDPRVTDRFVQRWPNLNATVQARIITRLLEQFDRTHALMAALEARTIAPNALTDVQINFLRNHRDQTIAARALQLYGPRAEVDVARLADALPKTGSATRGRQIFVQRCVGCHAHEGEGGQLGPDLITVKNKTREQLLADIFNPSASVAPPYQTKVLQRISNQLLIGWVDKLDSGFTRVTQADGTRFFLPDSQVEDTFDQDWSLMPNTAAANLRAADLADLLAFIQAPAPTSSR